MINSKSRGSVHQSSITAKHTFIMEAILDGGLRITIVPPCGRVLRYHRRKPELQTKHLSIIKPRYIGRFSSPAGCRLFSVDLLEVIYQYGAALRKAKPLAEKPVPVASLHYPHRCSDGNAGMIATQEDDMAPGLGRRFCLAGSQIRRISASGFWSAFSILELPTTNWSEPGVQRTNILRHN